MRRANGVKTLKQALGKLEKDVSLVDKAVQRTKDEIKVKNQQPALYSIGTAFLRH
jgi:hypothetical protein